MVLSNFDDNNEGMENKLESKSFSLVKVILFAFLIVFIFGLHGELQFS